METIRKRPELVTLPEVPQMLAISEIPTDVWIMRINMPFTFTHLAQKGVEKAFVCINTGKSIMTFLGEETARITQMKKTLKDLFGKKYPLLAKHINIAIAATLVFGHHGRSGEFSPFFVNNVPKLADQLDECGFSQLPMMFFEIPIKKPDTWVVFKRREAYEGFILTQVGQKPMTGEEGEEYLSSLISNNKVLENLGCHLCETTDVIGRIRKCTVKPKKV